MMLAGRQSAGRARSAQCETMAADVADPERARRAMEAMLKMRKLDIAALRAAADGTA